MIDVEKLTRMLLDFAVEIRREINRPERFKIERELQEDIDKQQVVAAIARSISGKGSAADDALAREWAAARK